jgi:hypothetical protein
LRITAGGDNNPASGDLNLERKQCATGAGPAGALTSIRFVTGAMCPADQKSAIVAEEFVRPPIERCPGMDAVVDIGVVAPVDVHDEAFNNPVAPENVKFRGAARRDFGMRRRPHGDGLHRISSSAARFHREDGIGISAPLVVFSKDDRALRNWDFWPS